MATELFLTDSTLFSSSSMRVMESPKEFEWLEINRMKNSAFDDCGHCRLLDIGGGHYPLVYLNIKAEHVLNRYLGTRNTPILDSLIPVH